MAWYKTGLVSVNNGETVVTATGTRFASNVRVGDGFTGPDGEWYEVVNIASETVLGIYPPYKGPSVTNQSNFMIAPLQGYNKETADRLRMITDGMDDISGDVQAAREAREGAEAAEVNAKVSEVNAKASEVAAKASEDHVEANAVAAKVAEVNAKASEVAAKTSETNAKTSEVAAKASETSASESATTATTKASEASASATSALSSANTATTAATDATASKVAAGSSATAAANSATAALNSKNSASTSETNAANSATAANTSETNAEAAQVAAEQARDEAISAAGSVTGVIADLGAWDASTGVYPVKPVNGSAFWKVTSNGTVSGIQYGIGDTLMYSKNLDEFYKIDNTESVSSVNGKTGVIVITKADLGLDIGLGSPNAYVVIDLNTVVLPGSMVSTSSGSPNAPQTTSGFLRVVGATGNTRVVQSWTESVGISSTQTQRTWDRSLYDGVWSPWSQVTKSTNWMPLTASTNADNLTDANMTWYTQGSSVTNLPIATTGFLRCIARGDIGISANRCIQEYTPFEPANGSSRTWRRTRGDDSIWSTWTRTDGTGKQDAHANLSGLSSLTSAADRVPMFNGAGGQMTLLAAGTTGKALLPAATPAAARTVLELTRPVTTATSDTADFNTITAAGWHTATVSNNAPNSPKAMFASTGMQAPSYWYIHNTQHVDAATNVIQVAYPYATSGAYIGAFAWRSAHLGTWTAWQRTVTPADITSSTTDSRAGKLIKVGDFGLGATGAVTDVTNVNTVTASGLYRISPGATNVPDGAQYCTLLHSSYEITSNNWTQFIHSMVSPRAWLRSSINGAVTQTEVYTQFNALGTVAFNNGGNTGSLMETGSTVNGNFRKTADGVMECWGSMTTTTIGISDPIPAEIVLTLPAAFSDQAFVVTATAAPSSTWAGVDGVLLSAPVSNSTFRVNIRNKSQSQTFIVYWRAIGRWRA